MHYFDETEVRKSIQVMKPNGQLFEIRIIGNNSQKPMSGYFTDANKVIEELRKRGNTLKNANVYITLNEINLACYSRGQKDEIRQYAKASTSDNDIDGYDWLMVDIDPSRPTDTSSSDEQIEVAKNVGNEVYKFMNQIGFEKPLSAFSGNGVHLLYKVNLARNDKNKELIHKCLKVLDLYFSNDEVKVDVSNHNPARVCKLYGTLAQKGSDTEERPHRLSRILSVPSELKTTDIAYIEKLATMYPQEPEKPRHYNKYNPVEFDIEAWMDKYGLRYRRADWTDGTKYILDACPFDSNHTGKDACIFKARNGAIGFHCFHNSCSDKTWQDVRVMFEPDAYERKQQEQNERWYGSFNRNKPEPQPIVEQPGKPVFYTAKDILNLPKENESFIKTGITEIDKKMRGLKKGYVSVVSGSRGSAKSTVLSGISIDAIDAGNNVGVFSGELSEKNFMRWMNLQAAGKSKVEPTQYEGYYNVPKKYQEAIADWMSDRFWLYNNAYGNNFKMILDKFEQKIVDNKLDLLILDNLMAFNISDLSDNKYEAQTQFVWSLHELAQKYTVHIAFVAHPRKSMGFLRLDDISGTADIANAVENAFIVHRNNSDFHKRSKEMFGWKDEDAIYKATNIIEIAKDRDGGTQDVFVPLWYEPETKRLKNNEAENKIYSWDKFNDGFEALPPDYEPVFD